MTQEPNDKPLSRRAASQWLFALSSAFVLRCGRRTTTYSRAQTDASSSGNSQPSSTPAPGQWARGGTVSMRGSYADPFTVHPALASVCAVAVATTGGPCTEEADRERRDISEGYCGLPMRIAFKIVDESCRPLANAKVKVWHTQQNGRYSGDTPAAMCHGDSSDIERHYFRGVQRTDSAGRVDFNSCFPGWYPGRAVHIHVEVTLNGRSYVTQVGFDQRLCTELFERHPDYREYGQPDTANIDDGIIGGAQLHSFVAHTERLPDGALLAAKQIVVRVG